MTTNPTNPIINEEDLQVTDLDHMVQILTAWHANQVSILTHLLEMPEGSELQIGDEDLAEHIVLAGNVRRAFRLGIELSLNHLGSLPFNAYTAQDSQETPSTN